MPKIGYISWLHMHKKMKYGEQRNKLLEVIKRGGIEKRRKNREAIANGVDSSTSGSSGGGGMRILFVVEEGDIRALDSAQQIAAHDLRGPQVHGPQKGTVKS